MEEDIRVQCLVFIVHDNDHSGNKLSPTCTRKLRSSTAQPRRCQAPRMLRNSVCASVPLARAFVMLPKVFSRDRRSLLALFQQNDILVVNSENITRLLVGNDHLEVFEILLDDSPSASINPLCLYTPKKYLNVVELLLPNVKIRFKYENRDTIKRLAVDEMNLKFIKRLLEHGEVFLEFGCHPLFGSYYGTLLHMAMFNHSHQLARTLIGYGADVHRFLSFMGSTLHLAMRCNSPLIQELIDRGISVDTLDYDGTSPLHDACTAQAAQILLENGANVNCESKWMRSTPLMEAVKDGNIQLIRTLLYCGADVHVKDHRNRSILDLAYRSKKSDVLEFLLEFCFSGVNDMLENPLKDFYQFLHGEFDRLGDDLNNIPDCMMVTASHFSLMLSYQYFKSSEPLASVGKIQEELVKMSRQRVGCTDISFFDVLTKSPDQIASLLRNKEFANNYRHRDLEAEFPVYGTILKYQRERGRFRKGIQQLAVKICSRLFSSFKTIPDEVQWMIISHLSTQDVLILRRIFMPPET